MYLLRGPHAQSLLQTISRVNRPYKSSSGKVYKYGYIVDFVDIEQEYDKTIEAYIKELEADLNENGENEGSLTGLVIDKEDINRKYHKYLEELEDIIETDNPERFSKQLTFYNKEKEDGAGGLREYIENDKNILLKLSGIEISKIKDIIVELGIYFYGLDFEGVDRELFDFIIEQRCYKLNHLMLYAIFRVIKPECLPILLCKKDLCLKVIEKEHLAYWKQLSSCLSNCIDEEKKDIWDYLLANQRVEASWDNYIEYRNRFGVTDTLVRYADKNMDELMKSHAEDGPTDSMIKELLAADISIESFIVLIKAHRVKEFTNSFIEFGESEIEIMIEEHYFDFTPERYIELKKSTDGLHINFAIKNDKDFFEQIDECNIDLNDVKKLLNEDSFDKQQVELLLKCISSDDIDEKLALQIRELGFAIPQDYVCAAWDVLKDTDKYQLLLNQLDVFTLDEVAHRFSLLGDPYDQFAERKRHKYKLFATEYNQELCRRLYDRGFLSSCDIVDEKVGFDSEANKDITEKYIVGYVKKKV